MKDYDKNKEFSYLKYLDVNNLYGWIMSQKFPIIENGPQFIENFTKSYDEESDEGYEQYLEKLNGLHSEILFLPERIKTEKVERLVGNLHDGLIMNLSLNSNKKLG